MDTYFILGKKWFDLAQIQINIQTFNYFTFQLFFTMFFYLLPNNNGITEKHKHMKLNLVLEEF